MCLISKKAVPEEIIGNRNVSQDYRQAVSDTLSWIQDNTLCFEKPFPVKPYRIQVRDAIFATLRETFNIDPALVFSSTRKRGPVTFRARALKMYRELTGCSLYDTIQMFEHPTHHTTLIHYDKMLSDINETDKFEKQISSQFRSEVLKHLLQDGDATPDGHHTN